MQQLNALCVHKCGSIPRAVMYFRVWPFKHLNSTSTLLFSCLLCGRFYLRLPNVRSGKGLRRCPLGSCDCAEAEHFVQLAAARRKSPLLLLQTGSCLPETYFLENTRESLENGCRGSKWNWGAWKNGMFFMPGNIFLSLWKSAGIHSAVIFTCLDQVYIQVFRCNGNLKKSI